MSSRNVHVGICKFVLKHFIKDFRENNFRKQCTLNGKPYSSQVFYKYITIFLHAMDNDGNTYLHLAAEGNQASVCELLLKCDTDIITLLNKKDESAKKKKKKIVQDNGHKDVLKALKIEYEKTGMLFFYYIF